MLPILHKVIDLTNFSLSIAATRYNFETKSDRVLNSYAPTLRARYDIRVYTYKKSTNIGLGVRGERSHLPTMPICKRETITCVY